MRHAAFLILLATLGLAATSPGPAVPPHGERPTPVATSRLAVDQAQWLTRAQAVAAYRVLLGQTEVRRLCQPCGERTAVREAVTRPVIALVPGERGEADHYEIVLLPSGDAVDLAYVYVRVGPRWMNLARQIGMTVSGVTTLLI